MRVSRRFPWHSPHHAPPCPSSLHPRRPLPTTVLSQLEHNYASSISPFPHLRSLRLRGGIPIQTCKPRIFSQPPCRCSCWPSSHSRPHWMSYHYLCRVDCAVGYGNLSLVVTATCSQPWSNRSHVRRDLTSVHSKGSVAPTYSSSYCCPFPVIVLY